MRKFSSSAMHLVILLAVTLLVYSNIFGNTFLWDDRILIHANQNLHDPGKWSLFIRDFWAVDPVNTGSPYFRPLVSMSYISDYVLYGEESPFGFHLTNLFFHLIATLGAYLAARSLLGNTGGFVAGLLYGIHPVHTESVTWIAGRTDVIMAAFFLFALYAYFRYRALSQKGWYLASVILFFLSIHAKEVAVTFPAVIIAYDVCMRGLRFVRLNLLSYLPFILVVIEYTLLRRWALHGSNFVFTHTILRDFAQGDIIQPLLKVLFSVMKYIVLSIWPFLLSARQIIPDVYGLRQIMLIALFFLLLGLGLLAAYSQRRTSQQARLILFAALFFFINIVLVCNLFAVRDGFAERFIYLASWSLCLLAGLLYSHLRMSANEMSKTAVTIMLIFVIIAFSITTYDRNQDWHDPLTLWQAEVQSNPLSAQAHMLLGVAYTQHMNLVKAIAAYQDANAIDPDIYEVHMNLKAIYLSQGDLQSALHEAQEMYRINPQDHKSPGGLGELYMLLGKPQQALPYLEMAAQKKPQHEGYQYLLIQAKRALTPPSNP